MDYSPKGSFLHGISQARILEWVAISFSRGSSQPRDQTRVSQSSVAGGFSYWLSHQGSKISCARQEILVVYFIYGSVHLAEGNGTPLQYSCLENPMDGGAWWAAVHGVTEGQTRLSDFTFTFHFHALEKEMATHSSVLAWRIQGMVEPGGLLSLGLHRVGHDWSDLAAATAAVCIC